MAHTEGNYSRLPHPARLPKLIDLERNREYLRATPKWGEEDGVHATGPPVISQLLAKGHNGDQEALRALVPLLYDDLRQWHISTCARHFPAIPCRPRHLCMKPTCASSNSTLRSFKTDNTSSQSAHCSCARFL